MEQKQHTISLTPELENFVQNAVKTTRYETVNDVIQEGLRLLKTRENSRAAQLEEIRQKIAIGLEQANQGELEDGEAFFDRLEQEERSRILDK